MTCMGSAPAVQRNQLGKCGPITMRLAIADGRLGELPACESPSAPPVLTITTIPQRSQRRMSRQQSSSHGKEEILGRCVQAGRLSGCATRASCRPSVAGSIRIAPESASPTLGSGGIKQHDRDLPAPGPFLVEVIASVGIHCLLPALVTLLAVNLPCSIGFTPALVGHRYCWLCL